MRTAKTGREVRGSPSVLGEDEIAANSGQDQRMRPLVLALACCLKASSLPDHQGLLRKAQPYDERNHEDSNHSNQYQVQIS